MRNRQVDAYMEKRFGKPDFAKAFYNFNDGRFWTPMGTKYKLWRVDPELVKE